MVEVSELGRSTEPAVGGTARWRRATGALWREVHAGVLVLAPAATDAVMLSGTGVLVWELLAEPASLEELARSIAELQDVDRGTVLEPLATLLDQLRGLGLASASASG